MMLSVFLAMTMTSQLPGEPMLRAEDAEHVKVYYEAGRFGGWPANYGMWSWGNEILVGYSRGYYKDLGATRHHIDREKPEEFWLARSLDGGKTWTHEHPSDNGSLVPRGESLHGTGTPGLTLPPITDLEEPMNFTHPDFVLTFRMEDIHAGTSRFEYSYDRGKTWKGPYRLPNLGTAGTAARTDYIVNGKHDAFIFITVGKTDGREGRPLCARTTDGGVNWERVSWIGPEPIGFAIMPSTVRISDTELFTTLRCREGTFRWMSAWRSVDNGKTWTQEANPVDYLGEGNPPMLNKLPDGRLCLTYGFRAYPFSIRARLSTDKGKTWGPQIVLREDGTDRDVGYVRSIVRPDGKVVTTYYFDDQATGPERYIGATIWDPDKVSEIVSGDTERQKGF
ncbi:MAG: glycoside hydrolase [Candidatus Hydrogenedentes bacterium]|nr:glycoside hydrolase [Candidatus Hydrogenedentota bacterium]